jgi:hypothetical protein
MIGGDTRTAIEGGAQVAGPEPGPTVGETRPKRLGEGGGVLSCPIHKLLHHWEW